MRLALLYDRIRWDEKALVEVAEKSGIPIELVDCKAEAFEATALKKTDRYDGAIQRCVSFMRYLYSTAVLERAGVKVVNSFQVAQTCGNKLLTTVALTKARVPTPRTKIAFTIDSALKALEEIGYPAILKPMIGSWGRLVALLKDPDSAKAVLETWDQMGNAWYKVYYLQEFVAKLPRDIRCVVVGDEAIAAIYRYAPKGEWRTNLARGGKAEKCELTDEIVDLSVRASKAVGGGVMGVDLIETEDGLVVNEINHNVEFRRTVPITGVDIPSRILGYVINLVK